MDYHYVLVYGKGQIKDVLSVHHTREHAEYQRDFTISHLGSHPDNLEILKVPCPDQ